MPAAWQDATVVAVRRETPTAKTFRLRLPEPSGHRAGQHYVVRLTAPDGYRASRSYSVASAPDGTAEIELTVERLPGGEVSSFLHDEVVVGDELEVRGPIGGWFVWEGDAPALLVGGGSGVVPLMAMLRLARRGEHTGLAHLLVSVRRPEDLYYAAEIPGIDATVVYTRQAPPGHARSPGRLTAADLEPLVPLVPVKPLPVEPIAAVEPLAAPGPTVYVCGSSPFADAATDLLLGFGVDAAQIRVERFGPSG